jgi:hypothetical protein
MEKQSDATKHILYRFITIFTIIFILISCEPFTVTPPPTVTNQSAVTPQAVFQSRFLKPRHLQEKTGPQNSNIMKLSANPSMVPCQHRKK